MRTDGTLVVSRKYLGHSGRAHEVDEIRLRLQDCKLERRRQPEGREPWMARVNPAIKLLQQQHGFRVPALVKLARASE